jgi:hypothetical protein
MSSLQSRTFTVVPTRVHDPKLVRRERLIERLEEQRQLAQDPSFAPVIKRWKKSEDGSRVLMDHARRIKPWWRADAKGSIVLTVRSGFHPLELEKGKPGIVVGPLDRLDAVLVTLIAAARGGELDVVLESVKDVGRGTPSGMIAVPFGTGSS